MVYFVIMMSFLVLKSILRSLLLIRPYYIVALNYSFKIQSILLIRLPYIIKLTYSNLYYVGGLKLNPNFVVDFGEEPLGPV